MREAYAEAMKGWSKAMEQAVARDDVAEASGRFLRQYVEMQESLRAASQAAADSAHLPTKDDLARLATLIVNVERKVDEVSDETHLLLARLAALEDAVRELARRDPPPAGS